MSCLFDSLSYFLKIPSIKIRNTVCDYLEANKPIMEGIDTKSLLSLESKNYIKKMRNPTTWGGGIEIKAIANIYNLKIKVKNISNFNTNLNPNPNPNPNPFIKFIPLKGVNSQTKKVKITWNGYHYEPIKKTKKYIVK